MNDTTGHSSGLGLLTDAARASWAAENRAAAARLSACYELYRECGRQVEAGAGGGSRPGYAVVDPFLECTGRVVAAMPISTGRAEAMVSLAIELTERYPAVLEALAAGRMDQRAAQLLARQLATVDPSVLHLVQEEVVRDHLAALEAGERLGEQMVRNAIDAIIRRYDADGIRLRKDDASRDRGVVIRKGADGMASLWATLAADEAAVLAECIDQRAAEFADPEPGTPTSATGTSAANAANAANAPDAGPSGASAAAGADSSADSSADSNTDADAEAGDMSHYPLAARRADALMSLVCGDLGRTRTPGAEPGDPAPPLRPRVTVFAPGDGSEPEVNFPRTGDSAIQALLDMLATSDGASLERIDPALGAADDARRALIYRPGAALARRIRLRDGTCRHPGCTVSAEYCDIDHCRPFDHAHPERGGHTEERNLMCLCRRHHRFKTFSGWLYDLAPDGTLVVVTPEGSTMLTRPSGPLAAYRREQTRAEQQAWDTQQARTPDPTTTATGDQPAEPTYWHRRAARLRTERARTERETARTPATGTGPGRGRAKPSARSRWWDRNKPHTSHAERQVQELLDDILNPPPF